MQMVQEGYQMTLDDLGIWSGKMCREHSAVRRGEDFRAVLQEIIRIADCSCDVPRPDTGRWESAGAAILGKRCSVAWRVLDAQYWGVPSVAVESFLWQILEDSPPQRYYLSQKACRGILERVKARGKKLPEQLLWALKKQAGIEG